MRDLDVVGRNLYFIDCDPVRPSGTSSTQAELGTAIATVSEVQTYLISKGWPEPIRVLSGNGCHLLFCGDICNAASAAWAFLLKELDGMFAGCAVRWIPVSIILRGYPACRGAGTVRDPIHPSARFSADCSQMTFQDLKNFLHEETGRWPQTRFHEPREEALERQERIASARPSVRTSCTTR